VGREGPLQASEGPEKNEREPCAHLGGLTRASELRVFVFLFLRWFAWGVPHLIEIPVPQKDPLCTPTHENAKKKQKKNDPRLSILNSRGSYFEVIRGQLGHIEAGSSESMCSRWRPPSYVDCRTFWVQN
jgi:hypothetical protein